MEPATPDWAALRAEFPALAHWTYLNTATFGQVPRCSIQAILRHFQRRDELACSDFLQWFDDADRIRLLAAQLIGAQPSDIAFIPNAATALGLLLGGICWRPGDRIVTLEHEFPNLIYHPALLATRGLEFVETPWERFWDAITPNTRLVLLSEVNYITGFRAPVADIAPELRRRGILLFVDGTQSAGALCFDASQVQPDMYAVHGYKWLLAPNGAGFMYVHPELRARLAPNVIGWRSHRDWRAVDNLHHGAPVFRCEAEKYEGGMIPFALLYALEASLRLILGAGVERIEQRVLGLADRVRDAVRQAGGRLLSDEAPHYDSPLVAARFPGRSASELARALASRRVLVSARHDYLRISPHFYNDESDVARFREELLRLL
ncbi:MAG: aminotransferase class V-fold PLP-dependent enzyme [Bryobacterales bacterium]|nr:aminotransferase class V-fold PLP-dependent enzyme [Bryobacteraceae bacterium]MDW8129354.1 aminotransferase class V-fold PLP-dependent enzyme [Bryobacterales bacterium]